MIPLQSITGVSPGVRDAVGPAGPGSDVDVGEGRGVIAGG
jgi:hypothetical protein